MNRIEQDAADTLRAHEDRAAFREAERARWARARRGAVISSVWAPPALTEQQQREHDQYVKQHNCPF